MSESVEIPSALLEKILDAADAAPRSRNPLVVIGDDEYHWDGRDFWIVYGFASILVRRGADQTIDFHVYRYGKELYPPVPHGNARVKLPERKRE